MAELPELLEDVLLVKVIEKKFSRGGIVLPQGVKSDTPQIFEAYVLKTGPGKLLPDGTRAKMTIRVGDRIVLNRAGKVDIDGEEFALLQEGGVIAYYPESESRGSTTIK